MAPQAYGRIKKCNKKNITALEFWLLFFIVSNQGKKLFPHTTNLSEPT